MQERSAFDIAMLVFAAVAAVAGVIAVLPLFGINLRIFGRPRVPVDQGQLHSGKRAWLALVLVIVSLGLSAGAFYYFFHPLIVERVVEKSVNIPCPDTHIQQQPEAKPLAPAKPPRNRPEMGETKTSPITPQPSQTCPNGICIGGENSGSATVNNFSKPDRHLTEQQKTELSAIIVPGSVKLTVLMTSDGEVQALGDEISQALRLPPEAVSTGLAWSNGIPQGITVQIHDDNQLEQLKNLGRRVGQILGAKGYLNPNIPAGEVRIIIGREP